MKKQLQVAVKEFFLSNYCERNTTTNQDSATTTGKELVDCFRRKFVKEAQLLSGFDHPNIIKVYDVFEENGTAYYVMEYIEGGSLHEKKRFAR